MIHSLAYYGNPVLRKVAEPVTDFGPELARLAAEMVDTMRHERGIGLAAPQIGLSLRLFVMEIPADMDEDDEGRRLHPFLDGPLLVVNPEIDELSDDVSVAEEGCLSIPEVRGNVERPWSLRLRFHDPLGTPRELRLQGLAARCVQHENDHLDGVLFIDHLRSVKRLAIKGKLRKIRDATRKNP